MVQIVGRWVLGPLRNQVSLRPRAGERGHRGAACAALPIGHSEAGREPAHALRGTGAPGAAAAPTASPSGAKASTNIHYHVEVARHHYSVPHTLVREAVEIRLTSRTVEIVHAERRSTPHARCHRLGGFTTIPKHRPKAHRKHLE